MEIHHHPKVEKKNFKEYFFEFLMLFLAVTLGFFAENIRENITEHHREKQYIISMLQDLRSDTAKLNRGITINTEQSKGYDSLINYWYAKSNSDSSSCYMYYLYRKYTATRHKVWFTHRTIDQLRNTGGLALIRSRAASDSIINYYEFADRADGQINVFATTFQHEALQTSYRIFDWSLLRNISSTSAYTFLQLGKKFAFLSSAIADQNTYIAQIQTSGLVLKNYINMLSDEQERCLRLISVLQKKYHLENE